MLFVERVRLYRGEHGMRFVKDEGLAPFRDLVSANCLTYVSQSNLLPNSSRLVSKVLRALPNGGSEMPFYQDS